MGDARRKAEAREGKRPPACTCPLVSVTEVPPTDPECPVHGADARAAADRGISPMPSAAPAPGEDRSPFSSITLTAPGPNHWQDPEPEPNSFRCPHCGKWRPAYGFSAQAATLPNVGLAQLIAIFCGTCRVFLQIQIIALDPAGRGRTH